MTQDSESQKSCALTALLSDVEKLHLQKLQEEMHKCAAKCCKDRDCSVDLVHACIESCRKNLNLNQKEVQSKIIQKRIQGCVLSCNDEVKNKITVHPVKQQVKSYESGFGSCVGNCVDKNVALIPFIMKKMKETLASKPPDSMKSKPGKLS